MGSGTDRWVARALAQLPADIRTQFVDDPIGAIRRLGISVSESLTVDEHRDDGGHCDGVSFLDHNVMLYARTKSKRENFTLAHELGHWLINRTDGVYDWIGDQPRPMANIETMCDRIAQQLLLPQDRIDAIVGAGPIRARHVIDLNQQSKASRAAASIALVRRLPAAGAVAYASRDTAAIEHASIQPHPEHGWPTVFPWPGQELPEGSLRDLSAGEASTRLSAWHTPWGKSADYYIDAVADDFYVYMVFSTTNIWDIATGFAAQEIDYDARLSQKIVCCGMERTARGFPCNGCGQIQCPNCRECKCDKRAKREGKCGNCKTVMLPHLLNEYGLCESCA
jgi:Zn-dependent peptidase ImmA (M78 family)